MYYFKDTETKLFFFFLHLLVAKEEWLEVKLVLLLLHRGNDGKLK